MFEVVLARAAGRAEEGADDLEGEEDDAAIPDAAAMAAAAGRLAAKGGGGRRRRRKQRQDLGEVPGLAKEQLVAGVLRQQVDQELEAVLKPHTHKPRAKRAKTKREDESVASNFP